MPKEVLLRTSFTEYGTSNQNQATEEVRIKSKSSFTRRVHFTDAKEEYEPSSDCSSLDETMSGESDTFDPVKDDLSEKSNAFEPVQDNLSGERLTRLPRGQNFVRGVGFKATDGQSFVRGVGFKATDGQSFVRGVEKHLKQLGI